jgi:hypothetical protein
MRLKLTLATLLSVAALSTYAQNRLIADVHYVSNGTNYMAEDSSAYYYSGTKGLSAPKWNIPEFMTGDDSTKLYIYNTSGSKWDVYRRGLKTWSSDNVTTIVYDSLGNNKSRYVLDYPGTTPDTVERHTWSTMSSSWRNSSRKIYVGFSGANALVCISQNYNFSPAGWRNSRKDSFSYNGSGQVTYKKVKRWSSSSSQWIDSFMYLYTYSSGKISSEEIYEWNGSMSKWDSTRNLYFYSGSKLDSIRNEFFYLGAYSPSTRDIYTYTGSNPSVIIRQKNTLGTFYDDVRFNVTYNTLNQLIQLSTETWGGSAWLKTNGVDSLNRWYYGMWNDGISTATAHANNIIIYPSPASDIVNIRISGVEPTKAMHFSISDMQGRVYRNWFDLAGNETSAAVNDLPAGNYMILVNDGSHMSSRQFTINR